MHSSIKSPLRFLPALAAFLLFVSLSAAASKTYLIDFGAPGHQPYVYQKGDFGLATAPDVIVTEPATGDYAGFGYKNASYKLGAAVLSFPSVGGYNLDETSAPAAALVGSFFFSNPDREEVGSPVKFTLTTAASTDKITVSAIGSVQEGQKAFIIFEGTRTLIDSNRAFLVVVSKLTGKKTYTGSFSTEDGAGEANLGGFLITIESN